MNQHTLANWMLRTGMALAMIANAFGASQVSSDLQQFGNVQNSMGNGAITTDVVVQFKTYPPTPAAIASITQGGGTLKKQFKKHYGAKRLHLAGVRDSQVGNESLHPLCLQGPALVGEARVRRADHQREYGPRLWL